MKITARNMFLITLIVVICLSVGYSAYTASLNIDDVLADVRLMEDARVTGISVDSASDEVVSYYEKYNMTSVSSSISLPYENSSITYKVEITNFEAIEVGIYDITGLPDNLKLSIDEESYNLKDKLCDNSDNTKCNLGSVKDIYITVSYDTNMSDAYNENNTDYIIDLSFDFREFHSITYANITNNGYPTEIIDGDDLNITFTDDIPDSVEVTGSENYTYEKPNLTITGITSNITINGGASSVPSDGAGITFILDVYGNEDNYSSNGLYTDENGLLYFAGSETVNNYVKFATDDILWRIISINREDGYIKIVREYDSSLSGEFDEDTNDWETSDILVTLNTWYTDNLTAYSDVILQTPNWDLTEMDGTDVTTAVVTGTYNGSPIGLINIIEYTNSIMDATWMQAKYQWVMTKPSNSSNKGIRINGTKYLNSSVDSANTAYRPVVYLSSSVLFDSGTGTEDDYFLIS